MKTPLFLLISLLCFFPAFVFGIRTPLGVISDLHATPIFDMYGRKLVGQHYDSRFLTIQRRNNGGRFYAIDEENVYLILLFDRETATMTGEQVIKDYVPIDFAQLRRMHMDGNGVVEYVSVQIIPWQTLVIPENLQEHLKAIGLHYGGQQYLVFWNSGLPFPDDIRKFPWNPAPEDVNFRP